MQFKIKIPTINEYVFVYIGEDEKVKFKKDYKIEGHDISLGISSGNAIWCKNESIAIIIHELHHVVTFITDLKGIKDEEFQAYLQEYLYIQIVKKLEKVYDHLTLYNDSDNI